MLCTHKLNFWNKISCNYVNSIFKKVFVLRTTRTNFCSITFQSWYQTFEFRKMCQNIVPIIVSSRRVFPCITNTSVLCGFDLRCNFFSVRTRELISSPYHIFDDKSETNVTMLQTFYTLFQVSLHLEQNCLKNLDIT